MAPSLEFDPNKSGITFSAEPIDIDRISEEPVRNDTFTFVTDLQTATQAVTSSNRPSLLSDIPPALLVMAHILPPFLSINNFYRYLRSSDGEITIGKIERGYTQEDKQQYHFRINFVDRSNQQAGFMSIRYYPDPQTPDGYQSTISIEMQKKGNYYGFELFVQLLRHDYANPKVTSHYLRAIDIGRHLWLHFDGFRLVDDTLQQIRSALSRLLNRQDKMQMARDFYSPRRISEAFVLPEPNSNFRHLARIAFEDSALSSSEQANQTRFPGKLALLNVERPILHENSPEQLQYDAQLDLREGNNDFTDFEKSVADFWRARNLPQRFAHNDEILSTQDTEFCEPEAIRTYAFENILAPENTDSLSMLPPLTPIMGGMNLVGMAFVPQ